MADEADNAFDNEQQQLQAALAARKPEPRTKAAVGYCLNCSEPLTGKRFCDVDCADDYAHRHLRS